MENHGSLWGAFKDVVYRAASVINEFLESVTQLGLSKERLMVYVTFDEFSCLWSFNPPTIDVEIGVNRV